MRDPVHHSMAFLDVAQASQLQAFDAILPELQSSARALVVHLDHCRLCHKNSTTRKPCLHFPTIASVPSRYETLSNKSLRASNEMRESVSVCLDNLVLSLVALVKTTMRSPQTLTSAPSILDFSHVALTEVKPAQFIDTDTRQGYNN